jgi:hypothetical protein
MKRVKMKMYVQLTSAVTMADAGMNGWRAAARPMSTVSKAMSVM